MKILVADDEATICKVCKFILEKSGHKVVTASNGVEALTLAKDFKPEFIISDMLMPVMNGYEFVERYQRENPSVKVLLMTGTVYAIEENGYDPGKYPILEKPIRASKLVEKVNEVYTQTA
ncbi:response regulator [Candidatus Woesearchaeota archaeon]|nr:response regulator [Candidatus Woesearchaeota archaeon]